MAAWSAAPLAAMSSARGGGAEQEIKEERKVKRLETPPSVDSWLRNKTEFRLWIGEANNHDTALLSLILDDNKKTKKN